MYLTIQAVVLRITNYHERDALLTVLTKNHGKLTLKARGLRQKNNPMSVACQLLAYGEFTLFEYRGMYTINECHSIELFQNLRNDLTKLSLGMYFAQVAEVISQEDLPNPELLSLLLNSLYALATLPLQQTHVKAAFELKAACLAGYHPDLHGCRTCGNPNPDRFVLSAGQLECVRCNMEESGIRLPINNSNLSAIRYVCNCDAKKLFQFTVGKENMQTLSDLSEAYLSTQLERGFTTLDFYKSLLI